MAGTHTPSSSHNAPHPPHTPPDTVHIWALDPYRSTVHQRNRAYRRTFSPVYTRIHCLWCPLDIPHNVAHPLYQYKPHRDNIGADLWRKLVGVCCTGRILAGDAPNLEWRLPAVAPVASWCSQRRSIGLWRSTGHLFGTITVERTSLVVSHWYLRSSNGSVIKGMSPRRVVESLSSLG